MAQLAQGLGLSESLPLEGIGVAGFHALMATLQMRVKGNRAQKSVAGFLDTVALEHQVSGWKGILYNLV